jgi:hypothetical protein
VHAVERGEITREQLAIANRRVKNFTARYARPALEKFDLAVLRCDGHLALLERVACRAETADPTAVMDRLLAGSD